MNSIGPCILQLLHSGATGFPFWLVNISDAIGPWKNYHRSSPFLVTIRKYSKPPIKLLHYPAAPGLLKKEPSRRAQSSARRSKDGLPWFKVQGLRFM